MYSVISVMHVQNGLWASESNEDSAKDKLVVHQCPHYYCQCLSVIANKTVECKYKFNSTYPDQQCHCKRKGKLFKKCNRKIETVKLHSSVISYHNMYIEGSFVGAKYLWFSWLKV